MSLALALLALLPANLEGDLSARLNVSGGASPVDAQSEEVPFLAIELTPSARLRLLEGTVGVDLSYSPRFIQRFVFEGPNGAPAPELTGPISFHQGDLALRWRASPRTSLELSATGGYGILSFNDAVAFGTEETGAVDNIEVVSVGGRIGLASVVLPRGDVFRLSGDVSTFLTVTDGPFLTARDRARFAGSTSYLFAPTRVDGFELAVSGETSVYLDGADVANNPGEQASFASATVGWVRRLSRRQSGALRAGLLLLLNDEISVVPSVLLDWRVETYQSPGLRITTTLSAGVVGGTSSVDAVAEPRVVGGFDMRFAIVPSRSFGIGIAFNAPLPTESTSIPSSSSLLLTLPFTWQLDPGFDLELGLRLGLRGVIQTGDTIPMAGPIQLAEFGDTFDGQAYVGVAFDVASTGESRYER